MEPNILYLRNLIKLSLAPSVAIQRRTRGVITKYINEEVTEEEVNRLLFSIPYFDRPLCYYIMSDGIIDKNKTRLWVTDNWIREFDARIKYWAESSEWLEGELILIHFPGFMGRAMVDDDQLRLPRLVFEAKL